jgi:hypothetical protein
MATKTTTALETPLRDQLDRLASFDTAKGPVLSLYLDMRPDQNGQRDHAAAYMKRALAQNADLSAKIERHIADEVPKSASGLAIFASTKGDFFESIPLDVPVPQHEMHVGPAPHLYPLARLNDQYPRYAALLLDTNSARLFVFGLGATEKQQKVQNEKTRRTTMGGWSQARYQRRANNMAKSHMKEVVAMLDKLVADEHLNHIVVACDDATKPFLMAQLPKHLADKMIDIMHLDTKTTPDHEVLSQTLEALRGEDAKTDADEVARMLGAWRAGGLGVAGVDGTLRALEMGQVEALLIAATPATIKAPKDSNGSAETDSDVADQLVTKAQQSAARIRFIEDDALLAEVGGVGALLRFAI